MNKSRPLVNLNEKFTKASPTRPTLEGSIWRIELKIMTFQTKNFFPVSSSTKRILSALKTKLTI
ncbi:CLUMA_CG015565, isoform A [Clunio marinus]|uniref:CLUMA_CG015565, isoform A n=1 Tax=Clunio marinus TaxID=568069 RepID=A0A1J1IRV2_9DIPT|nr:CLUMA_CG015565, isoform A [Clunio marinus]